MLTLVIFGYLSIGFTVVICAARWIKVASAAGFQINYMSTGDPLLSNPIGRAIAGCPGALKAGQGGSNNFGKGIFLNQMGPFVYFNGWE